MQMEFEFADRPRRETRIREAAAVLGLLENDQRVLLAALWEGKPMTIDGEPCSLLPWSVSTLAEQLGCGRSSAGDAVARLKRLGLIDNGRKKLLVCWAELDRRTMPDKRRTIPDDPGQAPDDPGRSRTIAGRSIAATGRGSPSVAMVRPRACEQSCQTLTTSTTVLPIGGSASSIRPRPWILASEYASDWVSRRSAGRRST